MGSNLSKEPCRAASVGANLTLSGTQTVDGVALVAGNRCLAKDQTTGANNGPYQVNAGAWTRCWDTCTSGLMLPGHFVKVGPEGTANKNTEWVCTTAAPITLGTTALTYARADGGWDEWKTIHVANSIMVSAGVVATYVMKIDGTVAVVSTAAMTGATAIFPLDPASYAVTGKTVQCRVIGHVLTLNTAPLSTMNFSLIPISSVSATQVPTLAAASGSSGTIVAPAVNTMTAVYGAGFTMPAAGTYCLACVTTTATNAATQQHLRATLQVRAV